MQKAIITTTNLANGGLLNPRQAQKFVEYVFDETVLRQSGVRTVSFRNDQMQIDKIDTFKRAAVAKTEGVDPGVRRGISTSKVTLEPKEVMVPIEITEDFLRENIEGKTAEDTILRIFARKLANDLEQLWIHGDPLGYGVIQEDILENGSSTQAVNDSFLALNTGMVRQSDSGNIVDALDSADLQEIMTNMIKKYPTKFRRNKAMLRWMLSSNIGVNYIHNLQARDTLLGDQAVAGILSNFKPKGIPMLDMPLFDDRPPVVEHVTLSGTTPVALRYKPVIASEFIVTPDTLASTPVTPFVDTTDYVIDEVNGTIARNGAGAIGDGATVKVTYKSPAQMILTWPSNIIIALGQNIKIKSDEDIFKDVMQFAITVKVDTKFEELDGVVKAINIKDELL